MQRRCTAEQLLGMEERTQVSDTVDGRNPAPVDMVDIPLCTGFRFTYPRWLAGFLNYQHYESVNKAGG